MSVLEYQAKYVRLFCCKDHYDMIIADLDKEEDAESKLWLRALADRSEMYLKEVGLWANQ